MKTKKNRGQKKSRLIGKLKGKKRSKIMKGGSGSGRSRYSVSSNGLEKSRMRSISRLPKQYSSKSSKSSQSYSTSFRKGNREEPRSEKRIGGKHFCIYEETNNAIGVKWIRIKEKEQEK